MIYLGVDTVKIEKCIEDFITSIIQRDVQRFCNLLCAKDLETLRKKLYTNDTYQSINKYIKNSYLVKIFHFITPNYSYEYFKHKNKYMVKYYFSDSKAYFKTEFNFVQEENNTLISIDLAKIQVKSFNIRD
ncbi:hypothetical protein BJG88_00605 [Staphylococcus nepalensis]|nr:hypothetical protein BJG88_00605 [Staphylococcus nepalensis]